MLPWPPVIRVSPPLLPPYIRSTKIVLMPLTDRFGNVHHINVEYVTQVAEVTPNAYAPMSRVYMIWESFEVSLPHDVIVERLVAHEAAEKESNLPT